ncbi:hypothetical protein NCAS_0A03250 [Naumovozyma castellii]|uniref:PNPLA domain-containing protein n=1 Tax=Naumovozyma castellii TaxID=27288 RepID=G0V5Z3_NAUCA|nr:hypothetical protein NCAS_0A03250 [Naumovozyma castellii CBS 4309]CCC66883.1 hypothetical protein NCAS_0A03250 [Naumovozyma castellii CBS 4309]
MNLASSIDATVALQRHLYPMTQHVVERYYQQQSDLHPEESNKADESELDSASESEVEALIVHRSDEEDTVINGDFDNGEENDQRKLLLVKTNSIPLMTRFKTIIYKLFQADYERSLLIEKVTAMKQRAVSYDEWKDACLRLDELTDKVSWKQNPESTLYDYKLIENVTNELRFNRLSKNYSKLLYLIRTNWVRNLGDIGNVNLYRHSHVGTKYAIDDYMLESRLSLQTLLEDESDLDDNYLLGILQQTRRSIGRTALVLSGGGSFGLFHVGVLTTLFELDLLPRVISGSSAGAIVASIITTHHKDEIPSLLEHVVAQDFNIFKDDKRKSESENLLIKISRFFKNGTWFNNKHLINTMIGFLGDLTFREAYNRTGKILNITVSPATLFEQPRLLNNLTAPNVLIWSAVCASCSLPGIFPSSPLYEKDPKTGEKKEWSGSSSVKFVDGSVDNDLPISRLSEMFNVDHIIACQVNVHVVPFLKLSVSCVGGELEDEFSARFRQNLSKVYDFLSNEMVHLLEMGSEIGIAKNTLTKFRSVLSQQYSGDITILPDLSMLFRINELLANPSKDFILREVTNGVKATWPKISIIENHCGQEFALDKAISYLKGKIIVSSSIRNPLQFSNMTIGLINHHNQKEKPETEEEEEQRKEQQRNTSYSNVLDDNLIESESTNSLRLLPENGVTGLAEDKANIHNLLYSPQAAISPTSNTLIHRPRYSQATERTTKSLSFSESSSNVKATNDANINDPHSPFRKASTGTTIFQRPKYYTEPRANINSPSYFGSIDNMEGSNDAYQFLESTPVIPNNTLAYMLENAKFKDTLNTSPTLHRRRSTRAHTYISPRHNKSKINPRTGKYMTYSQQNQQAQRHHHHHRYKVSNVDLMANSRRNSADARLNSSPDDGAPDAKERRLILRRNNSDYLFRNGSSTEQSSSVSPDQE